VHILISYNNATIYQATHRPFAKALELAATEQTIDAPVVLQEPDPPDTQLYHAGMRIVHIDWQNTQGYALLTLENGMTIQKRIR
jgi:hypothetical protein